MTLSGPTETSQTDPDTPNYGAVIRQRRKALGMTLDDVAKATNLTIGFLSQVERGISSPSLSSFQRIAGALQTSLEQLIKVPEPYSEFVSKDPARPMSWASPSAFTKSSARAFPAPWPIPASSTARRAMSRNTCSTKARSSATCSKARWNITWATRSSS